MAGFARFDTDNDGFIAILFRNMNNYKIDPREHASTADLIDIDEDGFISESEFNSALNFAFNLLDADLMEGPPGRNL